MCWVQTNVFLGNFEDKRLSWASITHFNIKGNSFIFFLFCLNQNNLHNDRNYKSDICREKKLWINIWKASITPKINNSTNIIITSSYLSPQKTEHKKKAIRHANENSVTGLEQATKCGRVKPVNKLTTFPLLIIGSPISSLLSPSW